MPRQQQVKKGLFKQRSLAKGRPPTASKRPATLSKMATQKFITSHHQLTKQLDMAQKKGDQEKIAELKTRIDESGGLKGYQFASIQGQAKDRGGDSSEILVEWLQDLKPTLASRDSKIRMLEVGALSTTNACSRSGLFDVQRIDLFSETDGILQQDFMERPLPKFAEDQFDIISLSLVLNFVPSPSGRGEMLKRTCDFLDQRAPREMPKALQDTFPALFLVLPSACIVNSRYMNEELFTILMASLGYIMLRRKQSAKQIYYLWVLRDRPIPEDFKKTEVNPGKARNNFSIDLRA